jgi:hypothetical protein
MNKIAKTRGFAIAVVFASVAATMVGCASDPPEEPAESSDEQLKLCWPWSPVTIIADAKKSKDAYDACVSSKKNSPGYRWVDCEAARQKQVCDIWENASACVNAAGQTGGMSSDWQKTQGSTDSATACINEPSSFSTSYNDKDMRVCFYTDVDLKGEGFCANGGLIPNLPSNFRNKISSVVFYGNPTNDVNHLEVHMFSGTGFRGEERVLTPGGLNTGKHTLKGFNDKAKSIVIDRVRVPSKGKCERTYFHSGNCDVDEHL